MSSKRRSGTAKRTTSRKQPPSRSPWWKRPLVWVGGVATALAVGAAAAFGTGLGQSLFSAVQDAPGSTSAAVVSGPPVVIDSVDSSDRSDFSYVFPQGLILSPPQLESLNRLTPDDPQYDSWFSSRGGVVSSPAVLKLVVEGNRPHAVLIIDMGIIDHCAAALNGTLFSNGANGGSVGDLGVRFDLNLARPVPVNGIAGGNYFAAHSISLQKNEQAIFQIVSNSFRYCQYRIILTVVDDTKTLTEVVSDNGQPFQVSGRIPESQYKALYVGGTLPGTAAPFVRENPATGKPY